MSKVAVITGANRGIGLAISRQLRDDGFKIALVGRSEQELYAETLKSIGKDGKDFIYIQADISKAKDRERIVNLTVKKFGHINVLINNAGVAPKVRNDLLEMTEESFDYVLNINTKANMFLTQLVAKQMIKQDVTDKKRGIIINISSSSAEVSSISRGEYCVSKAGVAMLTKLYADRLAAERIFVYEIRPGIIDTDMTASVKQKYDELIENGEFLIARWGIPQDVADAVSAFCSDKFMYSTGNFIDVDGGFHIKRM